MVMSLVGLETENDCAGEGQQQFNGTDWKPRGLKAPRAVRYKNMVMRPMELGTDNHFAGEDQQSFSS
jgi:hypothetical protein